FQSRDIAATSHNDIRLAPLVVAGPVPNADAGGAMLYRLVHREPLGSGLFAGDDDVDVVAAAQAMVGDAQERIRIRRQIDPDDFGFFVHHVVNEAGILVAEAVVVLTPDMRAEEIIQAGNGPPP